MGDLAMTRLGFGTAGLGNLRVAMTEERAWDLLDAAWDSGVRHFDTAPHYGLGLAERRLGRYLATKPRDEYVVSTKVGRLLEPCPQRADKRDTEGFVVPADHVRRWDFTAEGVRGSLAGSLERLGLDRVDVLYAHDPERAGDVDALETGLAELAELRGQGAARAIGVGSMDTVTLLRAAESGVADLLMAAGRYTLATPDITGPVLAACAAHGVRVVAAAVFNSGLLAGGDDFDYGTPTSTVADRVARLEAVCRAHDVPLRTAALQFPLRHPLVRSVVVGGDTVEQVRQNAADLDHHVPTAAWVELEEVLWP